MAKQESAGSIFFAVCLSQSVDIRSNDYVRSVRSLEVFRVMGDGLVTALVQHSSASICILVEYKGCHARGRHTIRLRSRAARH